ncbi:hypothetical protein PIB30_060795 [Stylosanthes scabra]|uniref:F-box domain-containing protein n=1 Tax=Stylosanthes scabra TaxID=79078 RepID=A0ABU6WNI1_9FABA|nr:hypothetical protein [Stylosanthes scabra]
MPKRRKQRKVAASTIHMDVISTLPDEILCHILSFLPTRTSMATSVLSHRWRYLWKKVQVLDLNDDFLYTDERSDEEAQECFLAFLHVVVPLLHSVRKVRLSCRVDRDRHSDLILEWIQRASSKPQIRELYFSLSVNERSSVSPRWNIRSDTLVSLVLYGNIYLDNVAPGEISLPSLKNLELHICSLNLGVFLHGCPALETVRATLTDYSLMDPPEAIHMPRLLKSLTFQEQYSEVKSEHLEVDTPSLEYLNLKLQGRYTQILVCDYPNMLKASLDICPKRRHLAWLPKLLQALCKTKFLRLGSSTTECLLRAPVIDLPDFCNLIQLQLDFKYFKIGILIDMLHNCPKLQALKIYVSEILPSCIIYHENESRTLKRNVWTQPISIPNCIISHLNTVEYRGYQNTAEEHEFTAYILQRGLVLKTMTIHAKIFHLCIKRDISKALSKIPRGSSMCRLKVD